VSTTGWWLLQDTDTGYVGLAKLTSPSATTTPVVPAGVRSQFNAGATDYFQATFLGSNINGSKIGHTISTVSSFWGATKEQWQALIDSIDVGAIFQGSTSVAAGPSTGPGASSTPAGQKSGLKPSGSGAVPDTNVDPLANVSVSNPLDAIGDIFTWLTTPANWLKILEAIAGAIAIYLGIKSLAGIDTPSVNVATVAKEAVA
jgi:hypothetical protein